jgi:hypothetical protein
MGVSTPVVVTLTPIDFVDTTALFSGIDHDPFLEPAFSPFCFARVSTMCAFERCHMNTSASTHPFASQYKPPPSPAELFERSSEMPASFLDWQRVDPSDWWRHSITLTLHEQG